MRVWHRAQVAGSQSRQAAETPVPRGNLRGLRDSTMTPPALQGMQQQPVEVVALGVPAPQHMRGPAVGYPNNVIYPGQAVVLTDAKLGQLLRSILRGYR